MPITLRPEETAEIIRLALGGKDHRGVVVDIIDDRFVSKVIDFFREVVDAKLRDEDIDLEWYKEHFLDHTLDSRDIAMNSGLNFKTIENMRRTTRKDVVIEESIAHFDELVDLINSLIDNDINVDLKLTFRNCTVHLNLNETIVVVNALAVHRAAIRGGAWSAAGKQVEKPLMESLCRIFGVNPNHFTRTIANDGSLREVDFYLLPPDGSRARCEVKLMGQGNPEGADVARARNSNVFVASVLSDKNKTQLDSWGVHWTELQTEQGFLRFSRTLDAFGVPHSELPRRSDYSDDIDRAVRATFAP